MARAAWMGGWVIVAGLSVVSLGAAGRDVPLVEAVKASNTTAVRTLIQQRTDVNSPETDGTTALHWAARRDALDAADLLIRAGANVKAVNRYGVTPLALACLNGNAAMIDRLLKAGADATASIGEGETMLMIAARTASLNILRAFTAPERAGSCFLTGASIARSNCSAQAHHGRIFL